MHGNHLVREARRRAGLTQAELAERVGTTQSAIARLERGTGDPTMRRISELVAACGFELEVQLVPADHHDWAMVARNARLTPDERVQRALEAIHTADHVRRAGDADRARAASG